MIQIQYKKIMRNQNSHPQRVTFVWCHLYQKLRIGHFIRDRKWTNFWMERKKNVCGYVWEILGFCLFLFEESGKENVLTPVPYALPSFARDYCSVVLEMNLGPNTHQASNLLWVLPLTIFYFSFADRVSLICPGWPWVHSVSQASLKITILPY